MKPKLIKRIGRWYCSDKWVYKEFCGITYTIVPSQTKGFKTPEEAYKAWYDKTHHKSLFTKIKQYVKGYL